MMDSNFDSSASDYSSVSKKMATAPSSDDAGSVESCAVCGNLTKKQCARCKMVKYCSEACQRSHWNSEHKTKCKDLQSSSKANFMQSTSALRGKKASVVPLGGSFKILKQSKKMHPRGRGFRYPLGRGMPDVSIQGIPGNMLPVPYEMGGLPLHNAGISQPIPIGALASALANSSPIEQRTRFLVEHCEVSASSSRLRIYAE